MTCGTRNKWDESKGDSTQASTAVMKAYLAIVGETDQIQSYWRILLWDQLSKSLKVWTFEGWGIPT
jgi:hypothetical protein